MKPQRIQRKRSEGWRMPPNTIYVGRPGKWGNPFPLTADGPANTREYVVKLHAEWLEQNDTPQAKWINAHIHELRGKDLVCWCKLDQPCHADVLLRLAND